MFQLSSLKKGDEEKRLKCHFHLTAYLREQKERKDDGVEKKKMKKKDFFLSLHYVL